MTEANGLMTNGGPAQDARMPGAATCSRLLFLPCCSSYEVLRKIVLTALAACGDIDAQTRTTAGRATSGRSTPKPFAKTKSVPSRWRRMSMPRTRTRVRGPVWTQRFSGAGRCA